MFEKTMAKHKTNQNRLITKLNISKQPSQQPTRHRQPHSVLHPVNIPRPDHKHLISLVKNHLLKLKKNETSTPSYLIKSAATTHQYLQHKLPNSYDVLAQCASYLMQKGNRMLDSMGSLSFTECNQQKSNTCGTSSTQAQRCRQGKSYFVLNKIILPYVAYITKLAELAREQRDFLQNEAQIYKVWKHLNMLNSMLGFTHNFTLIGRYYLDQYGAFVLLLSQTLSTDINSAYSSIRQYITANQHLMCVFSARQEEQEQAQQFLRILQQVGSINEKLNQFYMDKYFYKQLQHIERPEWIDINSKCFDRIFKGTNCHQAKSRPVSQLFKQSDINIL